MLPVAIALLAACGGGDDGVTGPVELTATRLLLISGNTQTGTVGQPLPAALTVRVDDQVGNPMAGIGVTFAVTDGGGGVATASTTTAADGQASTTWTLGTTAGPNHQVTATGFSRSVTFAATADPDVGAVISKVSGDGQNAFRGTKVPLPVVVLVRDQFANPVPGHLVAFVALANSGTVDPAVEFTDVNGEARTGWTLSSSVGVDTAEAQSAGLAGDPVTFTATAHNLSISSVSPTPLVEGQAATIFGTGFVDAVPAQNVVNVGGEPATVTTATTTQLDITIPTACVPAGTLDVTVTAGGFTSAPFSKSFTPAPGNSVTLALGEQVIVQDPNAFCFQFAATANTETYLIGIQSVTEVVSSRTPVTLTSVVAAGAAPAPAMAAAPGRVPRRVAVDPEVARRAALLSRYRANESRLLQRDLEMMGTMPRPLRMAQAPSVVPPNVQEGDTIAINYVGPGGCNDFTTITTVARVVGARAVWLEDIANPVGGFMPADIQAFSDQLDNTSYAIEVAYFGSEMDMDANTRVVAVLTQEINREPGGVAGRVSLVDFRDPAGCPASNGGEFFYMVVPDPNGTVGDSLSLAIVREFEPVVVAHEFAHIIQIGRRTQAGTPLMTLWELEGQATLAEEVVGHAVEGRTVGQDYSGTVAYDLNRTATSRFWYRGAFINMGTYYGADLSAQPPRKVIGAPHDCTWLDDANSGVCVRGVEHGVAWSLLRWLSDHYGPSFVGGEQGFHRAIIDNTLSGFANIVDLIKVPIETLLAQWAAMLYVDNRVVDGAVVVTADPKLTMLSWDLFDVFEGIAFTVDGMSFQVHLLEPAVRKFQDFTDNINVRAASTGYFLVSDPGRPATAIRARGVSDGVLPIVMQYWVVRLQ